MQTRFSLLVALVNLLTFVQAQNTSESASSIVQASGTGIVSSTALYSQSNVPTGTPLSGYYNQPLRPQIHFSPSLGFINDPNGAFRDDNGTYHLYCECCIIYSHQK